jgi:hypothetical protein
MIAFLAIACVPYYFFQLYNLLVLNRLNANGKILAFTWRIVRQSALKNHEKTGSKASVQGNRHYRGIVAFRYRDGLPRLPQDKDVLPLINSQ